MMRASVVFFLLLSLASATEIPTCQKTSTQNFQKDDSDCSLYHMCLFGQLYTFACLQGNVFSVESQNCVPAHSYMDRCTNYMLETKRCPAGSRALVPHETHCAQYYDCGATEGSENLGWDGQLKECSYPQVFSETKMKCVNPVPGVCGQRQEPLDQCEYLQNQCNGHPLCVPCEVQFPSCRGRPNGINVWKGREGSPYYVVCQQQRAASTGMCQQGEEGEVIFSQQFRQCLNKNGRSYDPLKPEVDQRNFNPPSPSQSNETPFKLELPSVQLPNTQQELAPYPQLQQPVQSDAEQPIPYSRLKPFVLFEQ